MAEREPYRRRGRCVHCGQFNSATGDACRYSTTGHASLDLPDGKTCGDCVFIQRCGSIFGHIAADESCDFFPIRYIGRPDS
jgi:hypothetical protein